MGLSKMTLKTSDDSMAPPSATKSAVSESTTEDDSLTLRLEGVVYASVLNPEDGRKNWKDIVTAFCWAFRDDPGKTLLLKMSHHNKSVFMGDLLLLFSKLHPFRCRVIAIHGFLSNEHLCQIARSTDYYVNASSAEGQCLPLLEFMAEGVPAIAPCHTAMESYISEDNAFVVDSNLEPQAWPIDPRRAYRTTTQRISWYSLYRCFAESAEVLENDSARYGRMSAAAIEAVARRYSSGRIRQDLTRLLNTLVAAGNRR
jgi:glycosyltransferase involved in cell wall biosynthesis